MPTSYTTRVVCQVPFTNVLCPTTRTARATVAGMAATDSEWKRRIGARLRALRKDKDWSLTDLERELKGVLSKSRLGNYEQGTRLPGLEESQLLANLYGVPSSFILCLDSDDMILLNKAEQQLIRDYRALPERDRADYARRIGALASIYREPVADERAAYPALPGKAAAR